MIKIAFFSATKTDKRLYCREEYKQAENIDFTFFDVQLSDKTVNLAQGFNGVCVFVNDNLSKPVLKQLKDIGISLISLRCAGFNNVDLKQAQALGMTLLRVPAYSPMAVAEHAVALMLTLNRKTHKAYNRVREGNFTIEGLLGFDIHQKTIGIIGTGRIGLALVKIMQGFGAHILAVDPNPNKQAIQHGAKYVELDELYEKSDIISLHAPLLTPTMHMINKDSIDKMKQGVMLINTSRGALIKAEDLIGALKARKIGYLGLDVYEQEESLFFKDHSEEILDDDVFERLLTFPNVLITSHQAFYTREALNNIIETTLQNIIGFHQNKINPKNIIT